jgi:hypothetical protein
MSLLKRVLSLGDITPCSPLKINRSFGGTFRLHLLGRRISQARNQRTTGRKWSFLGLLFYPKMEATCYSETSVDGVISEKIGPLWEPQILHPDPSNSSTTPDKGDWSFGLQSGCSLLNSRAVACRQRPGFLLLISSSSTLPSAVSDWFSSMSQLQRK